MAAVSIVLLLLSIVGIILGMILAILLVLVAAVLLIPVRFAGRADGQFRQDADAQWDGWARWEADVRWGGVLLRMWLRGTHKGIEAKIISICGVRLAGRKRSKAAKKPKAVRKAKRKRSRNRPTLDDIRSYIREGARLVWRLTAALRLHMAGEIRFGFEDPSLTGLTLGALSVAHTPSDLHVQADWVDPGIEGWAKVRGRIYGIEVALALWSAYWRSPLGARLRQRFTVRTRTKKRVQEVENHGRAG